MPASPSSRLKGQGVVLVCNLVVLLFTTLQFPLYMQPCLFPFISLLLFPLLLLCLFPVNTSSLLTAVQLMFLFDWLLCSLLPSPILQLFHLPFCNFRLYCFSVCTVVRLFFLLGYFRFNGIAVFPFTALQLSLLLPLSLKARSAIGTLHSSSSVALQLSLATIQLSFLLLCSNRAGDCAQRPPRWPCG